MTSVLDLLELIRLNVRIYHNARVCGDWKIEESEIGKTCFHMPTQNDCLMHVPEYGDWTLAAGDMVIFPRELPHSLLPTKPLQGVQQHLSLRESQNKEGTSLLCGEISFQHRGSMHLLDALPAVMVISHEKTKYWLDPLTELIVKESLREGSNNQSPVLNRLCELLISYTLRCFIESSPHNTGIFALYSDKRLAKVLSAIHENPHYKWQLNELAQLAAMSRTRFANYFKEVSQWTPMQYVTWWRMQLAYSYLQEGKIVADVADRVGYGSEAAFNRAFKSEFNESPGKIRRRKKQS